jgi:protein-S-isoprenylcysteine O-methyltransferase Ste14
MKPLIRGLIEQGVLILSGILGVIFKWHTLPFFPFVCVTGIIFIITSLLFHMYCERTHKQAHDTASEINKVITSGIYGKIRHPLYLSMIVMNIGIALVFGRWISLIIAVIISVFTVLTVFKEEKYLLIKFPDQYNQYMKNVRWRMIPGLF